MTVHKVLCIYPFFKWQEVSKNGGKIQMARLVTNCLVNLIEDLTKMRIPSEINLPLTGSDFQTVYFEASWRSQGNNLETL